MDSTSPRLTNTFPPTTPSSAKLVLPINFPAPPLQAPTKPRNPAALKNADALPAMFAHFL
ncbi:hypothetical protein L211DRAFT_835345 [Terfezia boudieri ATCC MYA-4762]|uniref:Uncharacterized protein n=1 Tax=Terfezia boudieri ATCC MYA-4762 TaxID=1051890 RepID=A0A3N4LUE9_9PEZI|nr:hypothetical protein L211DRAFT_835345 [Terfezia boudieri ATCC MYA-4762]